jgi:hypothetical protein
MSGMWPSSLAWFAAASLVTPTICDSRKGGALGRKVSDEFTVPLCRGHHRELHRCGDEADWWRKVGVDPTIAARTLWLEIHPLPTDSHHLSVIAEDSAATARTDRTKVQSDRSAVKTRANRKRNSAKEKTPHGAASNAQS